MSPNKKEQTEKPEETKMNETTPEIPSMDNNSPAEPKIKPKKKRWLWVLIGIGVVILVAVLAVGGYVAYNRYFRADEGNGEKPPLTVDDFGLNIGRLVSIQSAEAGRFAEFTAPEVKATPQIEPYTINADLSNVESNKNISVSDAAQKLLVQNGFVVTPGYSSEFFELYENNRYSYIPSLITTDSVLHNFHLLFDYALKKLEEEKLIPALKELNAGMLTASESQYLALKGTEWEHAALRNVAFFTVATKLLEPAAPIGAEVKEAVEAELKLIEDHQGMEFSRVMSIGEDLPSVAPPMIESEKSLEALKEDYSQYIPRGHYSKSEDLKRYFKTMMWYGRITFRLKSEDEVKSAILVNLALGQNNTNYTNWEKIYEPTNFFVGKSDDITFYQFTDVIKQVYGDNLSMDVLLSADKMNEFLEAAKNLEPPQINSMPIFNAAIQPDRNAEIMGFRFMGQRFTLDASIFQRLITREVGGKGEDCSKAPFAGGRTLPMGLDVPAAMGSQEALAILKTAGEDQYACYPENMQKMREYVAGLSEEIWTQNLYWGWLYSLNPILTVKPEGYPPFMQNQAWLRKDLNAYLGSWTELKHDTILYAKQVYAEMGGAGAEEADDRGYVEPQPLVYARLAALAAMMREGLELRGVLSDSQKENILKLEEIVLKLKTISEKELENKKLSDEEYNFIRFYGGELEHLWLNVMKDEGVQSSGQAPEHPAALVADVATDPNGQVLEEGTGKIFPIYAVVPVDGKLLIARGGVFTYYEFTQPISNRLTDEEWRKILDGQGTRPAPDLPDWTQVYRTAE